MKRPMLLMALLVAMPVMLANSVDAQSLYQKRPKGTPDPYSDRTAHRVGDLLTIKVSENQKVTQDGSTKHLEKGSFRAALTAFGINPATFGDVLPDIGGESEQSYEGDARVVRSGKAKARIAARVHAVQPNGNLVVVGRREIWVDNDRRILTFHGIVRPDDIDASNVIESEKVADVRIVFKGTGPAARATTRGFLSRIIQAIIDFLWPF